MDIHPAVTHFPIALVVASFLFELMGSVSKDESLRKAGLYCLLMALFGAAASYWTGLQAESQVGHLPNIQDSLESHEQAAIVTLVLIGVLVISRIIVDTRGSAKRVWQTAYLLVCLITVISVIRTGYLGGELVQRYGAGVDPIMRKHPAPENKPVRADYGFDTKDQIKSSGDRD